jgi:hypothetical protein
MPMFELVVTIVYIIILIIAFLGAVAAFTVMIGAIFNPPDDIHRYPVSLVQTRR